LAPKLARLTLKDLEFIRLVFGRHDPSPTQTMNAD
jgi:hypothetical protein